MAPGEGKSPEAWPEMKVPLRYWHVVFDTLQGFSKNTSVGGISNAYRSLHTIRRLVWLSLFLVGCYFTVKDVVGVFNEYFSYPVITTVGVSHKETVTFPAVTVCNQNRIRCSMLIKSAFNASSGVDSDLLKISGCMDTMESCETVWEEIISAGNVDPTGLYEDSPCHYDCEFMRSWMMDLEGTQETQDLAKQLLDFGGCEEDHDHHMWTMSSSQQSPMAETPVSTATQETQAGGSKQQTQSTQQTLLSLSTLEPTIPSLQTASPTQQGTESTQETTESPQQTLREEFPAQEGQSPPEEIGTRKKRRAPSMRNSYDDNDYYDDDYYHSDFGGASLEDMDSGYNDQMEFLTMYSKMDPSVRELLGHSAEEMIFSCSYMGTKCSSKDFATVHSNSYGNCFSFNSAIIASEDKSSGKRKTSLVGKKFGLSLKLNVDRKEYLGSILSPQSGARIILHHPKSYPLIDQEGIDLSPAFATSVAVKQLILERLEDPYQSFCFKDWNNTIYVPMDAKEMFREGYTQQRCLDICLQDHIQHLCNCYSPHLPLNYMIDDVINKASNICNLTMQASERTCVSKALRSFEKENSKCVCNEACDSVTYESRVSASSWPSMNFETAGFSALGDPKSGDFMEKLKNNYLMVDIFFETMNTEVIKQMAKYEVTTLVSSLGGALSLYLGISLIIFVEILEFLFNLIFNSVLFCLGKYSRPQEGVPHGDDVIEETKKLPSKKKQTAIIMPPSGHNEEDLPRFSPTPFPPFPSYSPHHPIPPPYALDPHSSPQYFYPHGAFHPHFNPLPASFYSMFHPSFHNVPPSRLRVSQTHAQTSPLSPAPLENRSSDLQEEDLSESPPNPSSPPPPPSPPRLPSSQEKILEKRERKAREAKRAFEAFFMNI